MVEKNQEYNVEILDMGIEGEGIAKINGYTTFVKGVLKGEKAKIKILKTNKDYGFGKLLELEKCSEKREEPMCPQFGKCGGCNLQHLNYEAQLLHKVEMVKNTLKKQLGYEPLVDEIIGMGIPYNYRNKAQYPVANGKIGFYADRSHTLIENETCYIQNSLSDKLAKDAFKILMKNGVNCYDEKTGAGILRHIVTRVAVNTNEFMLVLVTNCNKLKNCEKIVREIVELYPNITSIIQNINLEDTNVILGEKCVTLYGEDFIIDKLGDYKFKISPLSFYQVNPAQTEILYSTAKELADLSGDEIVFDLYCGIGTISIFIADKCREVYGIEVVQQAVINAEENAEMNEVNNAQFFAGEVEKIIPRFYNEVGLKADVVFVDPPRKGCDKTALQTIIDMKPEKLVYISCNPATLARDLKVLTEGGFEIKNIKLVDMFPQTSHVETCVLLTLKNQ